MFYITNVASPAQYIAGRKSMIAPVRKLKSLWNCNSGAVVSIELVLVALIFIVGLIAGVTSLRDAFVSEIADTGLSVQNTNQSFSYQGVVSGSTTTAGSNYLDATDNVDDGDDIAGETVGIAFSGLPADEDEQVSLAAIVESLNYSFRMSRFGSVWTGRSGFAGGNYSASPYWPGSYTIAGTTITIALNAIGGGWNNGEIVLDASDPTNMTGTVTWTHVFGFVWTAMYQLFGS